MATIVGLELGVEYVITGPDGTRASFNDPTDTDFVGYLTNVTGIDSADVRENADDLTEGDGGVHGDFWQGRRPIVLEGMIAPDSTTDRNTRVDRLKRATLALRDDATLTWTPTDSTIPVQIPVRRQQPLRISNDSRIKRFQIGMVAADPRIYGQTLNSLTLVAALIATGGMTSPLISPLASVPNVAVTGTATNAGTASTPPVLLIYGPGANPSVRNQTTGKVLTFLYTLAANEFLAVDVAAKTIYFNSTTSRYSALVFASSDWWELAPGANTISLEWGGAWSAGAQLVMSWRDAWL